MLRGVLVVDKPAGITSYDVIRRVRRELKSECSRVPPIGHAGTLDPMASGVLLILLGEATRLSRFLMTQTKEYDAEVTFGLATDTDDITGQAVSRCPVPDVTRERMQAALAGFVGTIEQVPPRYSALKQDGQAMYRLARQGRPVQPRPRRVTIHALALLGWEPPIARLRCVVSSGTYIRALARDLGAALGSAATLSRLIRTRVGRFRLDDALSLHDVNPSTIGERLIPIERAVAELRLLTVGVKSGEALRAGRPVPSEGPPEAEGSALVRTADGKALYLVRVADGCLYPERLIYAD
ncbi:MAG: tRNA pseudouridine(55) synthase TruB [candidate division WOR-3 bacterium]